MDNKQQFAFEEACRMINNYGTSQGIQIVGTVVFTDATKKHEKGSTYIHQFKIDAR